MKLSTPSSLLLLVCTTALAAPPSPSRTPTTPTTTDDTSSIDRLTEIPDTLREVLSKLPFATQVALKGTTKKFREEIHAIVESEVNELLGTEIDGQSEDDTRPEKVIATHETLFYKACYERDHLKFNYLFDKVDGKAHDQALWYAVTFNNDGAVCKLLTEGKLSQEPEDYSNLAVMATTRGYKKVLVALLDSKYFFGFRKTTTLLHLATQPRPVNQMQKEVTAALLERIQPSELFNNKQSYENNNLNNLLEIAVTIKPITPKHLEIIEGILETTEPSNNDEEIYKDAWNDGDPKVVNLLLRTERFATIGINGLFI